MQGQCFCGAVRYRLTPPTDFAGYCHCQSCRSASGAPLLSWTSVPNDQFELLEGGDRLKIFARSPQVTWQFCSRCGTTLFYHSNETSGRTYVTVATLTSPLDRPLESHVSFEEKPAWFDLDPDLPRFFGKTDLPIDSLHQAASAGDQGRVKQLLLAGFPLDGRVDGDTPLMRAAAGGYGSICRFLLKRGADPEAAMAAACGREADPGVIRLLLEAGCSAQKMLPLIAEFSNPEAARVLLRAAPDLELPDDDGEFPLYKAAKNSPEMLILLLAQGADHSLLNRDGSHSLHYCACWGHKSRLKILLQAGVPPDLLEEPPVTALNYACGNGHYECAKVLLQAGADPNHGLFRAADYGSISVLELLLAYGADPNLRDEHGRTPREYAQEWLPDLLEKLRQRMAQYGKLRHRWHLNSRGERVLQVRSKSAVDTRVDGHAQIVTRLS